MSKTGDYIPVDDEVVPVMYVAYHNTSQDSAPSSELLGEVQNAGYDLLTTPITTAAFHDRVFEAIAEYKDQIDEDAALRVHSPLVISPLTPEDTPLSPDDRNTALIAFVSPWIDLGSSDPLIAQVSRQVFALEVAYAAFCGINNVVVFGPAVGSSVVQYARAIYEGLGMGPYLQLSILLPMTGDIEMDGGESQHISELANTMESNSTEALDDADFEELSAWDTWNTIRTICNYSHKLNIALELPRQLPLSFIQDRWYSEPVRLLTLPRTSFLRNAKNYPVLSKSHQHLLSRHMRLRFPPWILLSDVDVIEPPASSTASVLTSTDPTPSEAAVKSRDKAKDLHGHLRYMRHLQQTQPPRPPMERFGQGYQDYIQSPLQPLTDNLESITYEVFEKDPVKYEWYERAVAAALHDLYATLNRPIVVAVVGAGRGPLVTRVLKASQSTNIPIHCCAIEKNPNAYVLIQRRNATDPLWDGQVLTYKSDMRSWSGPTIDGEVQKVDILVSELLGSFGDNELSPECLDGVQHVLQPETGVNIPQKYDAFFTPIATPKIYADLLSRPGSEKWEIPAVVMLHQFDFLCLQSGEEREPDVRLAWSFQHPLPEWVLSWSQERAGGTLGAGGFNGGDGTNEHNARSCTVVFKTEQHGVCHGLAGYFETVLYAPMEGEPIELSTNPVTMPSKSKDMVSWFPIFFPLKSPLNIPDNGEIEVTMWRQTDDRRVWYEWYVEVYQRTGRGKVKTACSELHSSIKNACLM